MVEVRHLSPGTGGFFKWATSQSPALDITESIFRADQLPNHQDLGSPNVPMSCRGNVVLWADDGPFPGRASWLGHCPDTTIIEGTAALTLWNTAGNGVSSRNGLDATVVERGVE